MELVKIVAGTKMDDALAGAILPLNNNRAYLQLGNVYSTIAVNFDKENNKKTPVGLGVAIRYSANQVYCSLVRVAKEFEMGYVNVESLDDDFTGYDTTDKKHCTLLKINGFHRRLPDLSGLPQYFTAFAEPEARPLLQCIVDQLVENCFGTCKNMELYRNLTVDLYDSESGKEEHPDEFWRDFAGFLVADRYRYCEVKIKCESLLYFLSAPFTSSPCSTITSIQPLSPSTRPIFHEYDQSLSTIDRSEYLDFLFDLNGIRGFVALNGQHQSIGYIVGFPNRVLQCYADNEHVAWILLSALLDSTKPDSMVSFFLNLGSGHDINAKMMEASEEVRRVRRFHSRIVPSNVKRAKVFATNIGAHIY